MSLSQSVAVSLLASHSVNQSLCHSWPLTQSISHSVIPGLSLSQSVTQSLLTSHSVNQSPNHSWPVTQSISHSVTPSMSPSQSVTPVSFITALEKLIFPRHFRSKFPRQNKSIQMSGVLPTTWWKSMEIHEAVDTCGECGISVTLHCRTFRGYGSARFPHFIQ